MRAAGEVKKASPCPKGMAFFPTARFNFKLQSDAVAPSKRPVREIKVSGFCLERHEVAGKDYSAFKAAVAGELKYRLVNTCTPTKSVVAIGSDPKALMAAHRPEAIPGLCTLGTEPVGAVRGEVEGFNDPRQPVVGVTAENGMDYCAWKYEGGRLPTEIEWARAWKGLLKGYTPTLGGDAFCRFTCLQASDDATSKKDTCTRGKNDTGVTDVKDVWEWVVSADPNKMDFTEPPYSYPVALFYNGCKLERGGYWDYEYSFSRRDSKRFISPFKLRDHNFGFRCAVSVPSEAKGPPRGSGK